MLVAALFGAHTLDYGIGIRGADQSIVHPFGSGALGDALDWLLTPLLRWDATWYLRIAEHGYQPEVEALRGGQAFFPLYPLLTKGLGGFAGRGAAVVAATVISLAAFYLALRLLHRLAELDLGVRGADATVLLLAFAPVAYFFSAPYTESLFLLLSVGAFLAARQGRWALAGIAAGLASATRPSGAILLLPLAILYLYGPRAGGERAGPRHSLLPRFRVRPDVLWLALAPVGIAAFSLYLRQSVGDALAWQHVQPLFGRMDPTWPTEALRQVAVATADAVTGDAPSAYRGPILLESAYLLFAVVAIVGVFRRLPFAYGAYALTSLAVPFLTPVHVEPLRSFPRFVLATFPLTMWLATCTERRGITRWVVLASALGLAVLTALFASWHQYV